MSTDSFPSKGYQIIYKVSSVLSVVGKKEIVSIYFENEIVVSHDSCRKGVWKSEDVYKAMALCPDFIVPPQNDRA